VFVFFVLTWKNKHFATMAQRVINGEQYEALLIRGDLNGGPVPVAFASGVTISGVTIGAEVEVTNDSGNPLPVVQGLSIPEHDYIALTYSGSNLTGVEYKTGGSGGTTVGSLSLAYSGSTLISVTKI
jgi:hypothetical protein